MKAAGHAAKGHARKHAHASKHVHGKAGKHNPKHHKPAHHQHRKARVHTVGHHQGHAKGLAVTPGDVACCVSEALAASLRLLHPPGPSIMGADVLALHRAAGADDDAGAPISAVLEAAGRFGLGGIRPAEAVSLLDETRIGLCESGIGILERDRQHVPVVELLAASAEAPHGLILGTVLPEGQHAVYATPEGWWSWGELYCPWCDFPDATVDEAWAVTWQ